MKVVERSSSSDADADEDEQSDDDVDEIKKSTEIFHHTSPPPERPVETLLYKVELQTIDANILRKECTDISNAKNDLIVLLIKQRGRICVQRKERPALAP